VIRRLAVIALLALLPASEAAAQERNCVFVIDYVGREGARVETPSGTNYHAGGGVRFRCRNLPVSMASDSVAAYAGNVVQFIGNVRYNDSAVAMTANAGTYYRTGDRWESRGNVVARKLDTGTTLRGPALDYLRRMPGTRDTAELVATGRPTIDYFPSARDGEPAPEPYIIVANRVRVRGDDRVWASGRVTINRSDFAATSDSLRLDTGPVGDGTLVGSPVLRGLGADTFTVSGRRIDLDLDGREITYLTAVDSARLVSTDWDLVADTIGLDIEERKLQQTLAWGDQRRPVGVSDRYEVRGDSIAIDTPNQQLRELRTFGDAWVGSAVDSVSGERDWLAGDTVVAASVPRDTAAAEDVMLDQMRGHGDAKAFHVVENERRPERPSLNYVRGASIVLTFRPPREGEERETVARLDVVGQVEGIQLEPEDAPSTTAPVAVPPQAPGGAP
jgi:hypothetical protein